MKTKKFISLLACTTLALSATACGKPPMTQKEEKGKKELKIIKGFDVDMEVDEPERKPRKKHNLDEMQGIWYNTYN